MNTTLFFAATKIQLRTARNLLAAVQERFPDGCAVKFDAVMAAGADDSDVPKALAVLKEMGAIKSFFQAGPDRVALEPCADREALKAAYSEIHARVLTM